jgi:uncharacterized protein
VAAARTCTDGQAPNPAPYTPLVNQEPGAASPTHVPARRVSWPALIGILAAFALIPAIVDVTVLKKPFDDAFPDQTSVNNLVVTETIGLVIAITAVTALRWWPTVLKESLRTRRWVWVVPIALLALSLAMIDYQRLAIAGIGLAITLLLATVLLAASEELVFRGMVLAFMRERYREVVAAIATAALFGAMHVAAGPLHVLSSSIFGYLLYYMRRVSGGLAIPILVHATWDYAIFSTHTTADPSTDSATGLTLFLTALALLLAVAALHRFAEPRPQG